jgi:hypothetical protein
MYVMDDGLGSEGRFWRALSPLPEDTSMHVAHKRYRQTQGTGLPIHPGNRYYQQHLL